MAKKPVPNPKRFDLDDFLERVADQPYPDWWAELDRECARAEAAISGKGGPQARADGAVDYVAGLKKILFFFHHGVARPGAGNAERAYVYRIAKRGVDDGVLNPEVLKQFS